MLQNSRFLYNLKSSALGMWFLTGIFALITVLCYNGVVEQAGYLFVIIFAVITGLLCIGAVRMTYRSLFSFEIEYHLDKTSGQLDLRFVRLSPRLQGKKGMLRFVSLSGVDLLAGIHSRSYEFVQYKKEVDFTYKSEERR